MYNNVKNVIKPVKLDFSDKEINRISKKLVEILKSGNLILGKYTEKFEKNFSEYNNVKNSVALNSGTSALEVALSLSLKCCRFYDERIKCNNSCRKKVLVQSNTNFATVAAIIRAGAIPEFLDFDPNYFSPSYEQILKSYKKNKNIAGCIVVHIGGIIHPEIIKISKFCKKNNLFLIEDCAHAHGSTFRGQKAGTFGDFGCFSFFPTKVITTIEGGILTTKYDKNVELIKSFRNQGKRGGSFGGTHYDLGNSWRMSEISSFIGLLQLKKLNLIIKKRKKAVEQMIKSVKKTKLLNYCKIEHMDECSNYKFIIIAKTKKTKNKLINSFRKKGIFVGGDVYNTPCHQQPVFLKHVNKNLKLPHTNKFCKLQICPPVHSKLKKNDIKRICSTIEDLN